MDVVATTLHSVISVSVTLSFILNQPGQKKAETFTWERLVQRNHEIAGLPTEMSKFCVCFFPLFCVCVY